MTPVNYHFGENCIKIGRKTKSQNFEIPPFWAFFVQNSISYRNFHLSESGFPEYKEFIKKILAILLYKRGPNSEICHI
jgi:hypothetical protein